MVGRKPPPVFMADEAVAGDGDKRVMGVEIFRTEEERLVGGHQRQPHLVGEIERRGLRTPAARSMPLEFHVEAVAEGAAQNLQPLAGHRHAAGRQRRADGAERTARQADDPFCLLR